MRRPKMKKVENGQGYGFVLDRGEERNELAEEFDDDPWMNTDTDSELEESLFRGWKDAREEQRHPMAAKTAAKGWLEVESPDITEEQEVMVSILGDVRRKLMGEGLREYGPMDVASDERDLMAEAIDEVTDGLVYLHMMRMRSQLEPVRLEFEERESKYKLVYMAHPSAALDSARGQLRALQREHEHTHSIIAPWIHELEHFDDSDPEQRRRGLDRCKDLIARCDELWLCGDWISPGMEEERAFAESVGVAVVDRVERD